MKLIIKAWHLGLNFFRSVWSHPIIRRPIPQIKYVIISSLPLIEVAVTFNNEVYPFSYLGTNRHLFIKLFIINAK
jgi:hypothetical protein